MKIQTTLFVFILIFTFPFCNSLSTKKQIDKSSDEIEQTSQNFQLVETNLFFKIVEATESKQYDFIGTVTFLNLSGFDFNDMKSSVALEYKFTSGASSSYFAFMVPQDENKKWENNTRKKIKIYLSPIQDTQPETNDFSRTPEFVFFKYEFIEINIDKELYHKGKINLLPNWRDFQKQLGLR